MNSKKNKPAVYDEDADYNYDILPDGSKNPKRWNGFWRPANAYNDIFWWMSIFADEPKEETIFNLN